MKQQKIFTIDSELLIELRKERNQSKLMNDLLSDYFKSGAKSTKQEILNKINLKQKEVIENKQMIIVLKAKVETIEKKENLLKKIFKDIPDEILEDFKFFPKITQETLRIRFTNIYSVKYNSLKWEKVLKAYNQYFNKNVKDTKSKN